MSVYGKQNEADAAVLREYTRQFETVLTPAALELERLLKDHLAGERHVDRVTARAKSPDRFLEKAGRRDSGGSPRYSDPLGQVQDQIGARVVVFYTSDVEPIGTTLLKYFRHIEMRDIIPESEWTFGYFGRHYVLALPADVVPQSTESANAPRFFELQIKTLFQHAWSEANHDLGYKPTEDLSGDQKRRLAYTAAQAWGADRVFAELHGELRAPNTPLQPAGSGGG